MRHTYTVIEREPRRDAPTVLCVRVSLPVAALLVDPVGELGIRREISEQRIREAVACAERIASIVSEVIDASVIVRAGFCLGIAFGEEPELQVVPPFRPRQIVLESKAIVLVP